MPFIGSILDKSLKQESSSLLNSSILKEDLHNRVNRCFRNVSVISVSDHFGETNCCLRVDGDNCSEELGEVRRVVLLLAIRYDLVELASGNETLKHLIVGVLAISTDIYRESKLRIELINQVSKLRGKGKLVSLDPVFKNLKALLLKNWSDQLNRLNIVQLSSLKES